MAETNEDRLSRYGKSRTELLTGLKHARNFDVNWKKGESWGLVYHAGNDVDEVIRDTINLFSHGNGLDPR